jgi:hypothetical protein
MADSCDASSARGPEAAAVDARLRDTGGTVTSCPLYTIRPYQKEPPAARTTKENT